MDVLRRSVALAIVVNVLMAGGMPLAWAGLKDPEEKESPFYTSDLPPVDGEPLPDFGSPIIPPPFGNPGGGGGDGGGGGGGGGGDERRQRCELLMATRPSLCPNPIPLPTGALYGEDVVPGSSVFHLSSMRMAIAFVKGNAPWNGVTIAPSEGARMFMEAALEEQTSNFASGMGLDQANARMRVHLGLACNMQADADSLNRLGINPTKSEEYCFQLLKAFDSEANDHKTFIDWFIEYSKRTGIPLSAYVPFGIVDMAESRNSIGEKWRKVTEDGACSRWWTQVNENMCGVP